MILICTSLSPILGIQTHVQLLQFHCNQFINMGMLTWNVVVEALVMHWFSSTTYYSYISKCFTWLRELSMKLNPMLRQKANRCTKMVLKGFYPFFMVTAPNESDPLKRYRASRFFRATSFKVLDQTSYTYIVKILLLHYEISDFPVSSDMQTSVHHLVFVNYPIPKLQTYQ